MSIQSNTKTKIYKIVKLKLKKLLTYDEYSTIIVVKVHVNTCTYNALLLLGFIFGL